MVIGLHFFSPANVMRLVEVVRGCATSKPAVATAMTLAKSLKKVGVAVRNGFGFVGNRMMFPYMYEAQFLAEEGASPERIDRVLTDFGMAMGIFAVDDMAGIDVAWRVREEFRHLEKPGSRRPITADKLYTLGRYGQKTGRGWFRYAEDRKAAPDPEVIELLRDTAREHNIPQRQVSDQEILERCLYGLINEGARVLEDGTALRPVDIDVIYVTGYGFPAWRGGPMFWADTVGLKQIYDRIVEFEQAHGDRWKPAPLLEKLAEEGSTFADWNAARA
jgi:3-hydroxyacyl-CoA dehydrogenase